MTDKDIAQLFQKLNDDKEINRPFDSDRSWELLSERCGFDSGNKETQYGFRDYVEYAVWNTTHKAMKPLAASLTVFLLIVAGWMGAVNASTGSLPGDRLYPVKLSLEKAQLAVAFSSDQHAKLKIEFTSRRLDEMVEIAALSQKENPERVQLAINRFKDEVSTIKDELSKGSQTELAKAVGRKVDTYRTTVATSVAESFEGVEEVNEIIEDTKNQAVQVIITANEQATDEDAVRELEIAFEKQVASLNNLELDTVSLEKLELAIVLKNEGAYRRAFQLLKEVGLLNKE